MASGGASVYKGSDLIPDYRCSKCEEDDVNTEAQHFCPKCEHYLCDTCVRMHGCYFKKHIVYGRKDILKWLGFSIDRCDQHGDKLNVHCNDHQELCCTVCVALNHRLCSSISHLPDLARDFLKTEEFKQLPAAVDKMRTMLDELNNVRMKDQYSLKDSYKNTIAAIKALRKEINTILDQLEEKTVKQLDSLMKDLKLSVKDDLDTCAHMNDQLTTIVDKVEQISGKHKETNSFIGFRKWQIMLNDVTSRVQEIQRRPKEMMSFKLDKSVLRFLRNLNNLGYVERSYSTSKTIYTIDVYQAESQIHYSVKIKTDKTDCHIVGICEVPSGEVVIADCKNERVKLLNQQYKVIGHYDLHDPQGWCYIADNEVAIAGVDVYEYYLEVYFLTVDRGQLYIVRKIVTGYRCRIIANHEGQLYLCSKERLDRCTMDRYMKNKIYEDKSAGLTRYKCDVSPDWEIIYVLDK